MAGALRLMQAFQGGVMTMTWLELEAAQSGKGQHPEAMCLDPAVSAQVCAAKAYA